MSAQKRQRMWDPAIVRGALIDSIRKLDPRVQFKNPVMFIVEVGSVLTTGIGVYEMGTGTGNPLFTGQIALWLWFTLLFANFAEGMAEGRGKAQAATLRKARTTTTANRRATDGTMQVVSANELRKGDVVVVVAGEFIPVRRRDHRGRRVGGRIGHHRRIGSGHSRSRRRPVGGHGRHARAFRSDRRAHQQRSRRDLPRPHDCAGRGREASEDAQRNRARDSAQHPDAGLPAGGGDAAAVTRNTRARPCRCPCSWRCSSASFPPPSARCCRRSGSPAWTGWCSTTCWRCRDARSKRPATSIRCSSTRPAPSRWATARPPSFCRRRA